jgi:hypothetical protein
LEPWTSFPNNLNKAIEQGTQAQLKGGKTLKVSLTATVIVNADTVSNIDSFGKIS